MALRTILMVASVILLTGFLAYLFGWFPVNNPKCWLCFFLCFCCCFIISTILSIRKEAADNHKLEKGLQKLKEELSSACWAHPVPEKQLWSIF